MERLARSLFSATCQKISNTPYTHGRASQLQFVRRSYRVSTSWRVQRVGGGGRPRGGSRSYGKRPQRHWASGRRHDAALSVSKRESATAKCRDTRTGILLGDSSVEYSFCELAKIARERTLPRGRHAPGSRKIRWSTSRKIATPRLRDRRSINFSETSISRAKMIFVDRRTSRSCKWQRSWESVNEIAQGTSIKGRK